ncbi:MAG: ribonuclease HII [Theionarchaea archaeon]|nr:ribonuclease HII [Theionarchaea archaeon]MBU7019475.1 ribonuclease HII [Theionarchaea archaeon]
MLVGIDESGRGPVIGPLVVCAVAVAPETARELEALNLRDSKKYTRKKREELEKLILPLVDREIAEIPAHEIDTQRARRTLNDIEVDMFAQVLMKFSAARTIIVDACDVNAQRFGERVSQQAGVHGIISEHKADDTYPVVSAASILAKMQRDRRVDELKEIYGDFGSGYCSDGRTTSFLRDYLRREGTFPPITRSSWDTAKKILDEYIQCTLDQFSYSY